jgi:hypothetical protein
MVVFFVIVKIILIVFTFSIEDLVRFSHDFLVEFVRKFVNIVFWGLWRFTSIITLSVIIHQYPS